VKRYGPAGLALKQEVNLLPAHKSGRPGAAQDDERSRRHAAGPKKKESRTTTARDSGINPV